MSKLSFFELSQRLVREPFPSLRIQGRERKDFCLFCSSLLLSFLLQPGWSFLHAAREYGIFAPGVLGHLCLLLHSSCEAGWHGSLRTAGGFDIRGVPGHVYTSNVFFVLGYICTRGLKPLAELRLCTHDNVQRHWILEQAGPFQWSSTEHMG